MVRKIRELKRELQDLGFQPLKKRGKGDHEVWWHEGANITIPVDGKGSDDVHEYQERQIKEAKEKIKREM
ncbi:MAG: type II toxin-antitoxin system HicA family toxin [Thermomicrobiales bacterium]